MLHVLGVIVHSASFHGAMVGWATAAGVDYHAFTKFGSWKDAAAYQWSTATFRWFAGALSGAIMGAGFGAWLS